VHAQWNQQTEIVDIFVQELPKVDVRIVADIASTIQVRTPRRRRWKSRVLGRCMANMEVENYVRTPKICVDQEEDGPTKSTYGLRLIIRWTKEDDEQAPPAYQLAGPVQ